MRRRGAQGTSGLFWESWPTRANGQHEVWEDQKKGSVKWCQGLPGQLPEALPLPQQMPSRP